MARARDAEAAAATNAHDDVPTPPLIAEWLQ